MIEKELGIGGEDPSEWPHFKLKDPVAVEWIGRGGEFSLTAPYEDVKQQAVVVSHRMTAGPGVYSHSALIRSDDVAFVTMPFTCFTSRYKAKIYSDIIRKLLF